MTVARPGITAEVADALAGIGVDVREVSRVIIDVQAGRRPAVYIEKLIDHATAWTIVGATIRAEEATILTTDIAADRRNTSTRSET